MQGLSPRQRGRRADLGVEQVELLEPVLLAPGHSTPRGVADTVEAPPIG